MYKGDKKFYKTDNVMSRKYSKKNVTNAIE